MADFDLTQTDAQVQSILNDGQNMQGAGAQTTLTTESVLLKDVNGNYHKILKSSFTEAIRDTLAGLLVNNDKGTTINQIAAIASGDFGSITPANLASVLGVPNFKTVIESHGESIDDIDETGWFFVYGSPNGLGYTLVHPGAKDYRMQFRNTETNSEFKVRTMEHGTWTSWKRCDNFGANTPAELASLLGVGKWVEVQGTKNTPVSLPNTGSGRIFLFSPTRTSANMLCIGTDSGADKLNNPWYSNNVTFGIGNGTCTVTWTQNWTSVFIYIIGY